MKTLSVSAKQKRIRACLTRILWLYNGWPEQMLGGRIARGGKRMSERGECTGWIIREARLRIVSTINPSLCFNTCGCCRLLYCRHLKDADQVIVYNLNRKHVCCAQMMLLRNGLSDTVL